MNAFSYQCIIPLPVDTIDLYHWLIGISEEDYQGFSTGHRAIGLCKKEDGEGMINVESIGGNLLVQHYTLVQKDRDSLKLVSPKTDAYLFHLLKVNVGVEWAMTVRDRDGKSCTFTCEISINYPNVLLGMASRLVAGNYFIRRHLHEEAPRFAKHIEQTFSKVNVHPTVS